MKKLLLVAAMLLVAGSAFAGGINFTVVACPGGAGATGDAGTLDCAGGQIVAMLATWQPAEPISDLVGIDAILDVTVNGDVTTAATFWDLAVTNAPGTDHRRPTTLCTLYNNVWNVAGAGSAALGIIRGPGSVRLAAQCQRPTLFSAALNQKLFGFQMSVDASTSTEAGGVNSGCSTAAAVALEQIIPGSANNNATTTLTSPDPTTGGGTVVIFNGASLPTSSSRHSWGQLKSLYR